MKKQTKFFNKCKKYMCSFFAFLNELWHYRAYLLTITYGFYFYYLNTLFICCSYLWICEWYEWHCKCNCTSYLQSLSWTKKISFNCCYTQLSRRATRWCSCGHEYYSSSPTLNYCNSTNQFWYFTRSLHSYLCNYLGSWSMVSSITSIKFSCIDWFNPWNQSSTYVYANWNEYNTTLGKSRRSYHWTAYISTYLIWFCLCTYLFGTPFYSKKGIF